MKYIYFLLIFTTTLFPYAFSTKLPIETTQLIESFDCFSKDDKTMFYSYALALKYRMENVDNKEALVNSDLDYWRLWHIASDMERQCALHYKFSDIIEETITPTRQDKQILKKLRRVESSIHTDGSSESSQRMDKYDAKLRAKILSNPPKYDILPKNELLNNYSLVSLKDYTSNSIPQNIYEQINDQNLTGIKKDVLLRYALLTENLIRSYDKPMKKHDIIQERIYLNECKKYYNLKLQDAFYYNFTRKLANRSIDHNSIMRLKTEFLPRDVKSYCENNISKVTVTTFEPRIEKDVEKKKEKITVKLENLKKYLEKYNTDKKKKGYADQYFTLMKSELEKDSAATPSLESLKLLRLKHCIVGDNDKEDLTLILSINKDFRIEDLKERFYANIFNSQKWWRLTIYLKIKSEGESKELTDFFNCSAINSTFSMDTLSSNGTQVYNGKMDKEKINEIRKKNKIENKVRKAGWQKREILKYFCGEFANKPASNLNNKQAIDIGIIPKKYISETGEIIPEIGTKITFRGMPKGGVSMSYEGLGRGLECTGMTEFLNMDETIHFQNKTYRGLDYIMINDTKLMIDNFSADYAKKLCSIHETNTISFVKENVVKEHKYNDTKEYNALYQSTRKISSRQVSVGKPYSLSLHSGVEHYLLARDKSKIINFQDSNNEITLPSEYDYRHNAIMSKDGKLIAASSRKKGINYYDLKNKKSHTLEILEGSLMTFAMENTILILEQNKKIILADLETGKVLASIQPKFIEPDRKYFTPRIKSVSISKDSKHLYILSDKGHIEYWLISKKNNNLFLEYIKTLDLKGKLALSLSLNPMNDKQLIISTNQNSIEIFNRITGEQIKSYKADRHMRADIARISNDSRFILGHDFRYVYIWNAKTFELIDVIGSKENEIYGAMFLPDDSQKVLIIGKQEEIWEIKDTL